MTSYSSVAAATLCLRSTDRSVAVRCLAATALLSTALGVALRVGAPTGVWAPLALLLACTIAPLYPREGMRYTAPVVSSGDKGKGSGGGGGSCMSGLEDGAWAGSADAGDSAAMERAEGDTAAFACPGMPFVPWVALCANVGLMAQLPVAAWARFGIVTVVVVGADLIVGRQRRNRDNRGEEQAAVAFLGSRK